MTLSSYHSLDDIVILPSESTHYLDLQCAGLWMFCCGTGVQGPFILAVPWEFGLINQGLAGVNVYI